MCLMSWRWQPGADPSLLLLANRDEYYARPTLGMHWWDDKDILAGRDLLGGGTWLGVSRSGRIAAVTNYRDPNSVRADARSRGMLVTHFLESGLSSPDYLEVIRATVSEYNAFNLIVFDGTQFMGFESRSGRTLLIEPGTGGVSNGDFFSPWPKVKKLCLGVERSTRLGPELQDASLWTLLADLEQAPDDQLPQTGIPRERERELSSVFIATPDYGTRASTVLRISSSGLEIEERGYDQNGLIGTARFTL